MDLVKYVKRVRPILKKESVGEELSDEDRELNRMYPLSDLAKEIIRIN